MVTDLDPPDRPLARRRAWAGPLASINLRISWGIKTVGIRWHPTDQPRGRQRPGPLFLRLRAHTQKYFHVCEKMQVHLILVIDVRLSFVASETPYSSS